MTTYVKHTNIEYGNLPYLLIVDEYNMFQINDKT